MAVCSDLWCRDLGGHFPARDFFIEKLTQDEQTRTVALFRYFAEYSISNEQKFKKFEPRLFELKPTGQVRFLGNYREGRFFFVAIGIRKKSNKHKRADLERARRVLRENTAMELLEDLCK